MRHRSLFWRIYLYFLAVTVGALAVTAWYFARSLYQFHQNQVADDLLARGQIITRELTALSEQDPPALDKLLKDVGRSSMTRITLILPDGTVVADSAENPATMENHRSRPEIAAALAGSVGQSVRYSDTLRRRLMYVALPVRKGNSIVAVVRTSLPLAVVVETLVVFYRHMALGGLGVAVLFIGLTFFLSRRITLPLSHMTQASEQFAKGDLTARVPIPDTEELGVLARTLNQMAAQLNDRIRSMGLQHNEQKAVLNNMVEGVVAVDLHQCILHINPAAAGLLGMKSGDERGRHILELVRQIELQEFIGQALKSEGAVEREVVFRGDQDNFIQLHGAPLRDSDGVTIGAVVVMNDITRLKRLEGMRRDFVANVSHELKTPLTTLKGCVETLSDGAIENAGEARRFLGMMERQVGRLEDMVEDLLVLSRLEHESERGGILLQDGAVHEVLTRAVQVFADRAAKKGILLVLDCPEVIHAPIDGGLLEQAVGNLIDNAIKYSSEETSVRVSMAVRNRMVEIQVADQGIGIDKKHLGRIFERFYRVDAARSRAQGGTGLGLAIVKHIALAHSGSVAAESVPGEGSTFTIRIPLVDNATDSLPPSR